MIIRWISLVPSKKMKIFEAVAAGHCSNACRRRRVDSGSARVLPSV
jgi:hypothetical protein